MYGEPLKPSECNFALFLDDGSTNIHLDGDGGIALIIEDNTEPGNDNIRDVIHPDFDKLWCNVSECMFMAEDREGQEFSEELSGETFTDVTPFTSLEEARQWCLSIGMTEDISLIS